MSPRPQSGGPPYLLPTDEDFDWDRFFRLQNTLIACTCTLSVLCIIFIVHCFWDARRMILESRALERAESSWSSSLLLRVPDSNSTRRRRRHIVHEQQTGPRSFPSVRFEETHQHHSSLIHRESSQSVSNDASSSADVELGEVQHARRISVNTAPASLTSSPSGQRRSYLSEAHGYVTRVDGEWPTTPGSPETVKNVESPPILSGDGANDAWRSVPAQRQYAGNRTTLSEGAGAQVVRFMVSPPTPRKSSQPLARSSAQGSPSPAARTRQPPNNATADGADLVDISLDSCETPPEVVAETSSRITDWRRSLTLSDLVREPNHASQSQDDEDRVREGPSRRPHVTNPNDITMELLVRTMMTTPRSESSLSRRASTDTNKYNHRDLKSQFSPPDTPQPDLNDSAEEQDITDFGGLRKAWNVAASKLSHASTTPSTTLWSTPHAQAPASTSHFRQGRKPIPRTLITPSSSLHRLNSNDSGVGSTGRNPKKLIIGLISPSKNKTPETTRDWRRGPSTPHPRTISKPLLPSSPSGQEEVTNIAEDQAQRQAKESRGLVIAELGGAGSSHLAVKNMSRGTGSSSGESTSVFGASGDQPCLSDFPPPPPLAIRSPERQDFLSYDYSHLIRPHGQPTETIPERRSDEEALGSTPTPLATSEEDP